MLFLVKAIQMDERCGILQKTVLVVAVAVQSPYLLMSFGHRGSQCSLIQPRIHLSLQSFVFLGPISPTGTVVRL